MLRPRLVAESKGHMVMVMRLRLEWLVIGLRACGCPLAVLLCMKMTHPHGG